jgi:hypothetical protein
MPRLNKVGYSGIKARELGQVVVQFARMVRTSSVGGIYMLVAYKQPMSQTTKVDIPV